MQLTASLNELQQTSCYNYVPQHWFLSKERICTTIEFKIYLENHLPFTHIYISVFFSNTISICLLATSCKCIYTTICDHFAHRNRLYKTVLYFHFRGEIKIYHNCTWISIIWFDGIYVINTPLNSNLNRSSNILFLHAKLFLYKVQW